MDCVMKGKGPEACGNGKILAEGAGGQGGGEQPVSSGDPKRATVLGHCVKKPDLSGGDGSRTHPGQGSGRAFLGGYVLSGVFGRRRQRVLHRGRVCGGGNMGNVPGGHSAGGNIHEKRTSLIGKVSHRAMLSYAEAGRRETGRGPCAFFTKEKGRIIKNLSLTVPLRDSKMKVREIVKKETIFPKEEKTCGSLRQPCRS